MLYEVFSCLENNENISGFISFHVENSFTEVIIKYKEATTMYSYWFDIRKQSFNMFTDTWYYNE